MEDRQKVHWGIFFIETHLLDKFPSLDSPNPKLLKFAEPHGNQCCHFENAKIFGSVNLKNMMVGTYRTDVSMKRYCSEHFAFLPYWKGCSYHKISKNSSSFNIEDRRKVFKAFWSP